MRRPSAWWNEFRCILVLGAGKSNMPPTGLAGVRAADTIATVFSGGLVNLYTRDIEAGIRFYGELLGLTETFRTPREGTPEHVEFRAGGFTVGLGTVEAAKRVHGVDAVPGVPAAVVVLWADDVDRAYADLETAGVTCVQPPHDSGNDNRNALVRDPDGNLVELVSKRTAR